MRDWLTGLANRVALMDRLTQAILALERQPGKVGVLFFDVDDFKSINDTLGHRAGDEVLVKIAQRLSSVARRFDTVARYGGDEFVLLSTALTTAASLESIGERLLAALASGVEVDHRSLTVTASLGGVLVDDAAADPNDVLDQADAAMYAAKQAGRSRFEIFGSAGGR